MYLRISKYIYQIILLIDLRDDKFNFRDPLNHKHRPLVLFTPNFFYCHMYFVIMCWWYHKQVIIYVCTEFCCIAASCAENDEVFCQSSFSNKQARSNRAKCRWTEVMFFFLIFICASLFHCEYFCANLIEIICGS